MKEADENKPQHMTEQDARKRVLEIAGGIGVAMIGVGLAAYGDNQTLHIVGGAAATVSGVATVGNIINYVTRLG